MLAVRNGGPLLDEQLAGLARQTFTGDWELIVSDNGSTDGTQAKVQSWADRLPVRLVDASDRPGAAHARNVGAQAARAEVVAFIDADDIVEPDWLAEICSAAGPDVMVGGAHDPTTLNPPEMLQARGHVGRTTQPDLGPGGFLPFVISANFAIGRDLLERLGGWDESFPAAGCEDVDLCWRGQLAGYELRFCPTAVIQYRYREGLKPLYRQMVNYARNEVELYRRYRGRGFRRRSATQVLGRWWWLLSRLPYLAISRRRRYLWVAVLGEQVGRITGSVKARLLYL